MNINDIITNALTNILYKGLPFMGGTIDLASCVISITFSFVAIAYVYCPSRRVAYAEVEEAEKRNKSKIKPWWLICND
jgi:hypothetical protein